MARAGTGLLRLQPQRLNGTANPCFNGERTQCYALSALKQGRGLPSSPAGSGPDKPSAGQRGREGSFLLEIGVSWTHPTTVVRPAHRVLERAPVQHGCGKNYWFHDRPLLN